MKAEKLTKNNGYALTKNRILEITEELNGTYWGYNLGDVFDKNGNYSEQYKDLDSKGFISRIDEGGNALVYRPSEKKNETL